jgi:hypothetical protein
MRPFRTVSDPLAFAARLGRAREASAYVPTVALILRRLAPAVYRRVHMPLHFALRVMARAAAPRQATARAAHAAAAPGLAPVRERFHIAMRIVERATQCVARHVVAPVWVSVNAGSAARAPAAPPPAESRLVVIANGARDPAFPRVEQVLARAAPAASRAPASPARSAEVPAFERRPHRPPAQPSAPFNAAAPASLPPAELARVADHVIRELDHRVLSFRERTGRI